MRVTRVFSFLILFLYSFVFARAQEGGMASMPDMQSDHAGAKDSQMRSSQPEDLGGTIVQHASSGTSVEPASSSATMLMTMKDNWMLMFHANGFVVEEQQTGPRGGDKLFSTNWIMPMAQREAGRNLITLRAMLSFEPATVTGRQYPLLFQQGETAFGRPIVDGQHPHNFLMELAAIYDWKLGEHSLLTFYAAPVGDPAIGPTAFPHRASALENPVAPLGHHQEDSTHIAADVITAGFTHGIVRIEGSGFHGREPNEHRWQVQQGAIDSWSLRLTMQPGQNWSGQYSYGRLHSPEALFPTEDQERMTASVMYNRPLKKGNWASSLVWGRTRSLSDQVIQNSYLLESTLQFAEKNYLWTRMENVDRTTELLDEAGPEEPAGRVQAYTFGYDRNFS